MPRRLSVPYHPQEADIYCLPACVQMVLAYWGIERHQAELARKLETIEGAGTIASRVLLLISRTLDVRYIRNGEFADLEAALAEGIPPIAIVWTGELSYWDEATGHVVVVLGADEDTTVIHDPYKPPPAREILTSEFMLAWDARDNRYALLKKKFE